MAAVEAAAAPYVFEHAPRFAAELFRFAAAGRSLAVDDMIAASAAAGAVHTRALRYLSVAIYWSL